MSKKILIVTQHFHPENFRFNDFAETLVKRGVDVSVLTGLPNYPEGKFLMDMDCSDLIEKLSMGLKFIGHHFGRGRTTRSLWR